MVYCTSCGTKNPDDAQKCSKCGEPLYVPPQARYEREETCFGAPERRRYERDFCFGVPGIIFPLLIGVFIIMWGLSIIMEVQYLWSHIWPLFIIFIGLIIIIAALSGRR